MSSQLDEAIRFEQAASVLQSAADEVEGAVRGLAGRVAEVHGRPSGWISPGADTFARETDELVARSRRDAEALRSIAGQLCSRAAWLRAQATNAASHR